MINVLQDLWGKVSSQGQKTASKFKDMTLTEQLSAGGSAVSALQKFGAMMTKAREMKLQAEMERGASATEFGNYNQAMSEATNRFADTIARIDTAAAGSGVDVASGSVIERRKSISQELADFSRVSGENAVSALMARRARMEQMRADAKAMKAAGLLNLFTDFVSIGAGVAKRGRVERR